MNVLKTLIILSFSVILFRQCERDDRFYRPRMPQKLSALGIIDADDTARYILIEKSFQIEYPEDITDSLRDFSFTISNSNGVIYSFQADHALENQILFQIPDSITFITGEKYFFRAKERDCPEISSEITVPEPPLCLNLLSIEREIVTNYVIECLEVADDHKVWLDVISILFDNDKHDNSYYAILLESFGTNQSRAWEFGKAGKSYLEFAVRESDSPGFFVIFPGLVKYNVDPCDDHKLIKNQAHAYLIEGSKITGDNCTVVLTTLSNNGKTLPTYHNTFRIRLLSIPEEMYLFKKSLYTYERNTCDPFSEPVFLKGNIEGGYGIFSICRSIEIHVDAAPFRY